MKEFFLEIRYLNDKIFNAVSAVFRAFPKKVTIFPSSELPTFLCMIMKIIDIHAYISFICLKEKFACTLLVKKIISVNTCWHILFFLWKWVKKVKQSYRQPNPNRQKRQTYNSIKESNSLVFTMKYFCYGPLLPWWIICIN